MHFQSSVTVVGKIQGCLAIFVSTIIITIMVNTLVTNMVITTGWIRRLFAFLLFYRASIRLFTGCGGSGRQVIIY